jgi:hypothetical protein
VNEPTLMRAYRVTAGDEPAQGFPIRQTHGIVGAGAKVAPCLCGGEIYVDSARTLALETAVRRHQATGGHQLWWARAKAGGWGE